MPWKVCKPMDEPYRLGNRGSGIGKRPRRHDDSNRETRKSVQVPPVTCHHAFEKGSPRCALQRSENGIAWITETAREFEGPIPWEFTIVLRLM